MTENAKKLLEMLSQDKNLSEKFCTLEKDELMAAAKELGITLTDADFAQSDDMSDSELAAVSGGKNQNCYCAVGGGGKADPEDNQKPCACVAYGHGWRDEKYYCECYIAGIGWEDE